MIDARSRGKGAEQQTSAEAHGIIPYLQNENKLASSET